MNTDDDLYIVNEVVKYDMVKHSPKHIKQAAMTGSGMLVRMRKGYKSWYLLTQYLLSWY